MLEFEAAVVHNLVDNNRMNAGLKIRATVQCLGAFSSLFVKAEEKST